MNIDIVLFAGRIVLVALLYIFLFAVMKTGVGLVRGQRRDSAIWTIDVDKGPRGIRGIHVDMLGPVIVGRSPSSDICINEPFVSASHARFSLQGPALIIEDLNSLNGTLVNGRQLVEPATLRQFQCLGSTGSGGSIIQINHFFHVFHRNDPFLLNASAGALNALCRCGILSTDKLYHIIP